MNDWWMHGLGVMRVLSCLGNLAKSWVWSCTMMIIVAQRRLRLRAFNVLWQVAGSLPRQERVNISQGLQYRSVNCTF